MGNLEQITSASRVVLGGTEVDLMTFGAAVELISMRAASSCVTPLAVVSVNLDHIKHFGARGRWLGKGSGHPGSPLGHPGPGQDGVEWLSLLDGAPVVAQAQRVTSQPWPRLAGSDLIDPILDQASERGIRVGFLGGRAETHEMLRRKLASVRPDMVVAGCWAPSRSGLSSPQACRRLAAEVSRANVELLVVGLAKPRQEVWIREYGALTGAHVLLAFGAVVDLLAGRITRAPRWMREHGLEWAWRLALEPQRLARRYLAEGPPAYCRLRFNSYIPGPENAMVRRRTAAPRPALGG